MARNVNVLLAKALNSERSLGRHAVCSFVVRAHNNVFTPHAFSAIMFCLWPWLNLQHARLYLRCIHQIPSFSLFQREILAVSSAQANGWQFGKSCISKRCTWSFEFWGVTNGSFIFTQSAYRFQIRTVPACFWRGVHLSVLSCPEQPRKLLQKPGCACAALHCPFRGTLPLGNSALQLSQ